MKNLHFKFLIIFIFHLNFVFSQDKIELKEFGFSMNNPEGWFAYNRNQIVSNINQFDLNKDEIDRFSKQVDKSIEYITLSKYQKGKYLGAIPTINIRVDKNPTKDILELQKALYLSLEQNKATFKNLHFIEKSNIVDIEGTKIIRTIFSYTLKIENVEYKLKSYKVLIPAGKFYININFIEEENKEDNSILYEELINSIKIINSEK
jgi:hypothetical protein